MANLWKPQSNEIYQSWIDAIMDEASEKLTDWETDFITNMSALVVLKQPLTKPQADTLERLYVKHTN